MAYGHVCGSGTVHTQLLYPRLRQDDGLVFDAFCGNGSVLCFASTEQMETYSFPPETVRQIRFNGYGNNQNDWNSIYDFKLIEE